MPTQLHAITAASRRVSFWPSIAAASAQICQGRGQPVGRERPHSSAVVRPASPELSSSRPRAGEGR
jgi:hypothetical protein